MKIVVLSSARDDLIDGYHFYEDQGEGLGTYFLESLFSDVDSLILYAGIHRRVFGNYRLLSKRFPYGLLRAKIKYSFRQSSLRLPHGSESASQKTARPLR